MSGHPTATIYQAIPSSAEGFSQSLELYYKIGDTSLLPEWHGNLLLETESGLPENGEINLGFLLKLSSQEQIDKAAQDPNWRNGWDGIECKVRYQGNGAESSVFISRDVYHETDAAPNYANNLE